MTSFRAVLNAFLIVSAGTYLLFAQAQPRSQVAAAGGSVLVIDSALAGTLIVDGESSSKIIAGKITKIQVRPGQHIVELRSDADSSVWKEVVSVPVNQQVVRQINAGQTTGQSDTESIRMARKYDELCALGRPKESMAVLSAIFGSTRNAAGSVWLDSRLEGLGSNVEGFPGKFVVHCSNVELGTILDVDKQLSEMDAYLSRCSKYESVLTGAIGTGIKEAKEAADDNCFALPVTRDLYALGRPLDALRYANNELKWAGSYRTSGTLDPVILQSRRLTSDLYSLRGRIRFALGDVVGALEDVDEAIGWKSLYHKSEPPPPPSLAAASESLFDGEESQLHVWRAMFLRSSGRTAEARAELSRLVVSGYWAWMARDLLSEIGSEMPANHVNGPAPIDGDIKSTIARIEQGRHSDLPAPSFAAGTGPLTIRNNTGSALTVYLEGLEPEANRSATRSGLRLCSFGIV